MAQKCDWCHYIAVIKDGRLAENGAVIQQGTWMKKLLTAAAVVLMFSGCSSTKDWAATGGSRADGVVRLSFVHGAFEKPVLNESQAVALASKRCATWGYSGAEAFGGTTSQCNMPGGLGGCNQFIVTKEYQCLGQGNGQQAGVYVESVPAEAKQVDNRNKWF